jgi:hypothetical protein
MECTDVLLKPGARDSSQWCKEGMVGLACMVYAFNESSSDAMDLRISPDFSYTFGQLCEM